MLSGTKDRIIELADGKGLVCNVDFGFSIKLSETDDGRFRIEVDPAPFGLENPDYLGLRDFVEETAVQWLRKVAPHRLSMGANER